MTCQADYRGQGFTVIRGDTFSYHGHWDDADGDPIDLTDTEFEAAIETLSRSWTETLTVTKLDQTTSTGDFTISAGDTSGWPVGQLQIKLTRIKSGVRKSVLIPVAVERG